MAMGGERIAVAGPVDLGKKTEGEALAFANESEARAAFEGKKGIFLQIVNAADGKTLSRISLPAMPSLRRHVHSQRRTYHQPQRWHRDLLRQITCRSSDTDVSHSHLLAAQELGVAP
jgi:hypothetical protein